MLDMTDREKPKLISRKLERLFWGLRLSAEIGQDLKGDCLKGYCDYEESSQVIWSTIRTGRIVDNPFFLEIRQI